MKHVLYGLGTILSIISVIIFVSNPRDHRLDLSFSLYWVLVVVCLSLDCRNEMLRRERIQRNINSSARGGSLQV
jgi:hypothetical protein